MPKSSSESESEGIEMLMTPIEKRKARMIANQNENVDNKNIIG